MEPNNRFQHQQVNCFALRCASHTMDASMRTMGTSQGDVGELLMKQKQLASQHTSTS
jgi:hypothetical protein